MAKTDAPFSSTKFCKLLFVESEDSPNTFVFDGELSDQNYAGEIWRTDAGWANGDNTVYPSRTAAARALLSPPAPVEPLYEVRTTPQSYEPGYGAFRGKTEPGALLFIAPLRILAVLLKLHQDAEARVQAEAPREEGCELFFGPTKRPLTNDISMVLVTLHRA